MTMLTLPLSSGIAADDDSGRVVTIHQAAIVSQDSKRDNALVKAAIEEAVGFEINIIWTLKDNYKDKMNVVLASGEAFDAMHYDGLGRTWSQLASDNLILPLNDLLEEYGQNIIRYMTPGFENSMDAEGNIYAFPIRVANARGNTPVIRSDWAAQAGYPDLPRTVAEYEDYMDYVLNNDVNGNGDPSDEVPLICVGKNQLLNFFGGVFMGADGLGARYLNENGEIALRATHPLYMDYLTTIREWYEKGYLYKEFFVIKEPQVNDMVTADRIGGITLWYSRFVRPFESVNAADPSKDYSLLPTLESPNPSVEAVWNAGQDYQNAMYIPRVAKNPDLVAKLLNWIVTDPYTSALSRYGIEGLHWEWEDESQLVLKRLDGATENYDQGYTFIYMDPEDMHLTAAGSNYVDITYNRLYDEMFSDDKNYVYVFDRYVPYTTVGTELEFIPNDAATLLDENELKYIIGEIDRATMEKTINDYIESYGTVYSKVATQQYNDYMKQVENRK